MSYIITPKEAAQQYGTTVAYVYKLASLHQWSKRRENGRIGYDVLQVAERLSK